MRTWMLAAAMIAGTATAAAQGVDVRDAQEPTNGLALPTTPLAGEHDARAVSVNPGGLALLRGFELTAALDVEDTAVADAAGPGFGIFTGVPFGGHVLPRMGFGLGFEWLRPPRATLAPDPGTPFRFTAAWAIGVTDRLGLGVSWHHFSDDSGLGGLDTFDAGLSARLCNYLAFGYTLTDINTGIVEGTPVQMRMRAEMVVRPLGSSRLELAVGGALGVTRDDTDGWIRAAWRVARGVVLDAEATSRDLQLIETSAVGVTDTTRRELRGTVGLELAFGHVGIAAYGSGLRTYNGNNDLLGGTFTARLSMVGPQSVLGHADHIERVDLGGKLGVRDVTAIVLRLRDIARDPTAKAVVVTFDGASGGWAGLQELRDELIAVKRAGKPVFAYLVSGTSRDYFVASAADKIYVDPAGGLRLVGMAGTSMFFRGTFDLLGIQPQFEKIGEYKSAPEQFTETGPTEIARGMNDAMFDSLWAAWVAAVADGRHLPPARVKAIVDNGPYTGGELAANHELVDAVASPDKISELITRELHAVYPVEELPQETPEVWREPGIAVIYIDGDIVDGKSKEIPFVDEKLAGGETIAAAIAAARADSHIRGIILRIDSPGGSALASELIAREVFATRTVKPIVCSMSNLAASGGYFVAAGCDTIFAEPMTITGSIGIFFGKFDISGLVAKLGITTQTYRRGARADVESMFRPYTDEERGVLLDKLKYSYSRFLGAVADGRGLTKAQVDAVGRGHVFTGADALPIKLVDRFGGIGAALDEVKHRLGLAADQRVHVVELPGKPASILGWAGNLLGVGTTAPLSITDVPAIRTLLRGVPASVLASPDEPQARLPFELIWE